MLQGRTGSAGARHVLRARQLVTSALGGGQQPKAKKVRLERILSNLGYCTRKEAAEHVRRGAVTFLDGQRVPKASVQVDPYMIHFNGEPLDPLPPYTLIMHKPAGYTCSTRDSKASALVYDLLPERYARRDPVLATVGRLDAETTGLLLLTDDGDLLHRITAPKKSIWKVYEATLARDLTGEEGQLFASGTLVLDGDEKPLAPAKLEVLGTRKARLAIQEGRYHQVRRMFAAAGNHVEALQRVSIGGLLLDDLDLPERQWMPATAEHIAAVFAVVD